MQTNETGEMAGQQSAPILQSGNRHYRLDVQAKRITFLDQRFYFDETGKAVPSVTTILEAYPKGAAFFEWLKRNGEDSDEIRDEAGRRGSRVHNLTEKFDKGEEVTLLDVSGEISMSVLEWAMFERYVQFRERNPALLLAEIEQNYVDAELGYGGTVDRVFVIKDAVGRRIMVDIKTSSMIHAHYWLQLAAYKKMMNKRLENEIDRELLKKFHVDGVAILWLNAKTRTDKDAKTPGEDCQGKGWQLVTRTAADEVRDITLFNATHKLWLAENESAAPRVATYQIAYKAQTEAEKEAETGKELSEVMKNGKGPKQAAK
jgi:hypothetical protein